MSEVDDCDHPEVNLEHASTASMEFWLACEDCPGYWTLTGDLERETANLSLDDEAVETRRANA